MARATFQIPYPNTNFNQKNVEITKYAEVSLTLSMNFFLGCFYLTRGLSSLSRKLDFFMNEYTYLLFKVNNNSEEYCKNRADYSGNHGLNI